MVGEAPAFRRVLDAARQVAATDAAVFVTGESGTGKEMVARYIHDQSARHDAPFAPLNCAALPEGLFESELFGHRRGAFTGAVRDKPGILEAAGGGTAFLDELLEMPVTVQAKLLRVLQDGEVRRVGSERSDATVDVRLICATNGDPEEAVRNRTLREDLFFRLHVVPIRLPPLRERPEDIPVLAEHFLARFWRRYRPDAGAPPTLGPEARWALAARPWRGNVRELQNTMEHLVVLAAPGETIRPERIPFRQESDTEGTAAAVGAASFRRARTFAEGYHAARRQAIAAFERDYLQWFLARAGKNLSRAARRVGIDRATLYRLRQRHGLLGGSRKLRA